MIRVTIERGDRKATMLIANIKPGRLISTYAYAYAGQQGVIRDFIRRRGAWDLVRRCLNDTKHTRSAMGDRLLSLLAAD